MPFDPDDPFGLEKLPQKPKEGLKGQPPAKKVAPSSAGADLAAQLGLPVGKAATAAVKPQKKAPASTGSPMIDRMLSPQQKPLPKPVPKKVDPLSDFLNEIEKREPKGKPKQLSGPVNTSANVPQGRGESGEEKRLRQQQLDLEGEIRRRNAKGLDVRQEQKQLFTLHHKIASFDQNVGQSPTRQMQELARSFGMPEPEKKPDASDQLPFHMSDFQNSLSKGLSQVPMKANPGQGMSIEQAKRYILSKNPGAQFTAKPADLEKDAENQATNSIKAGMVPDVVRNPADFTGTVSGQLDKRYQDFTGNDPKDEPFQLGVLKVLAGLADSPNGMMGQAEQARENLASIPGMALDQAKALNPLEPGLSGADRLERSINLVLTVAGIHHGITYLRGAPESPVISSLAKRFGVKPEEASQIVERTVRQAEKVTENQPSPAPEALGEPVPETQTVAPPKPQISSEDLRSQEALHHAQQMVDAKAARSHLVAEPEPQPVAAQPTAPIPQQKGSVPPGMEGLKRRVTSDGVPFYEDEMNPKDLHVHEGLQYKQDGITDTKNMIGSGLKDTESYNHGTAGPLTAWQRLSGDRYVMNGHHRRELAIRHDEPTVPVKVFHEADGVDFAKAKGLGALQNVQEGKGSALDAARVIKDFGYTKEQLAKSGVNLKAGLAKDAFSLTKLNDESLRQVEDGLVKPPVAAGIADYGLDPVRQKAAMRVARGLHSRFEGELLAQNMKAKQIVDRGAAPGNHEQGGMFDDLKFDDVPWEEQTKLEAGVYNELTSSARGFGKKPKIAGETFIDKNAQMTAAEKEKLGREALKEPSVVQAIEQAAHGYAANPTKEYYEKAVERIANVAREAGEERRARLTNRPSPKRETQLASRTLDRAKELPSKALQEPEPEIESPFAEGEAPDKGWVRLRGGGFAPPEKTIPRFAHELKRIFSPASISENATYAGDRIREMNGNVLQDTAVHEETFRPVREYMGKLSKDAANEFIDRYQAGDKQANPYLQKVADSIHEIQENMRKQVFDTTGKLEKFNKDYFPQLYKDPKKVGDWVERIYSKGQLQGNRSFLRQKKYVSFAEARAAGFEPRFSNPLDIVLANLHQMSKYAEFNKMLSEFKTNGTARYLTAGAKMPEGYDVSKYDRSFTVHHSGNIVIHEGYDANLVAGLEKVARDIGVPHNRLVKIGAPDDVQAITKIEKRKGMPAEPTEIRTKFGSPEAEFTHELGHAIDFKYGFGESIDDLGQKNPREIRRLKSLGYTDDQIKDKAGHLFANDLTPAQLWDEGKKLAQLRYDGHHVSQDYKDYVESHDEIVANALKAYIHAPELFHNVAPNLYKYFDEFLHKTPELKQLTTLRPSLVLDTNQAVVRAPGIHVAGQYIFPSDVAAVLNNHLSPGLRGKWLYDKVHGVNNLGNLLNLSFSLRHLVVTGLNSSISDSALGYRKLASGDLKGLTDIVKGHIPLISPIEDYRLGERIRQDYVKGASKDPRIQKILDGVTKAGMGYGQDKFYVNDYRSKFSEALKNDKLVPKALGAASNVLGAIAESTAAPMMNQIIPRIKFAAFGKMLELDLAQAGPGISEEEFRRIAAKASDHIDNRFGQLRYDNLFWNKVTKDIAMSVTRSVGWNLGTAKVFGGAVSDILGEGHSGIKAISDHKGAAALGIDPNSIIRPQGLKGFKNNLLSRSNSVAYVGAMTTTAMLYNALINWKNTGKAPETIEDYFYPKSGNVNADGSPERMSLPVYIRDLVGFVKSPMGTISNKAGPVVSTITRLLHNQDYRGTKLYNEDDPYYKQGLDVMKSVASEFTPFSLQGQLKSIKDTGSPDYGEILGISKAPRYIDKTPAIELAEKYFFESIPQAPRTSEEAERGDTKTHIVTLLRNGKKEEAEKAIKEAKLTDSEEDNVYNRAEEDHLPAMVKKIRLDKALKVYAKANAKEQKSLYPILMTKLENASDSSKYTNEQIQGFKNQFKKIVGK